MTTAQRPKLTLCAPIERRELPADIASDWMREATGHLLVALRIIDEGMAEQGTRLRGAAKAKAQRTRDIYRSILEVRP